MNFINICGAKIVYKHQKYDTDNHRHSYGITMIEHDSAMVAVAQATPTSHHNVLNSFRGDAVEFP